MSTIYAPGGVESVAEQPDGKLLVVGNFFRINGSPAYHVSRFNTNGSLDAAFQQNVGTATRPFEVTLAPNGKIYLSTELSTPITAGGITRTGVLRLNADGTGDTSFNAGNGLASQSFYYLDDVLPLANGQSIVVGAFESFNGVPANCIVRLTASGAVDPTFNTGTGTGGPYSEITSITALPNGKYMIAGEFDSFNGTPCNGLARLNADGSFDPTFTSPLVSNSYIINMTVQPDGKILLSGTMRFGAGSSSQSLARVLPSGAIDPGFTPPALNAFAVSTYSGNAMQVQPDGKILFINRAGVPNTSAARVARLNIDGTLDTSFQVGSGPDISPATIKLLANGRILVGGFFNTFNTTLDRTLVQLNSSGTIDPSFQPLIQNVGNITSLQRQPDGKYVAGGNFSEINGQIVRRLTRFNPSGSIDATFTPPTINTTSIASLALQPDGRLLVVIPQSVQRLLANGSADNSFTPPTYTNSFLTKMLLQADGRIVLAGYSVFQNGTLLTSPITRLLSNGSVDNTFSTATTQPQRIGAVFSLAQQANGKLLVGESTSIKRLEVSGAPDATFTSPEVEARSLALQSDGKILVGSNSFAAPSGMPLPALVRLTTAGGEDLSFTPPAIEGLINSVVIQPNNRILLGGAFTSPNLPSNLARVLTTGQADVSFAATAAPNGAVQTMLVQADGKIVLGGSFTALSGQPSMSLARITATNVLHMAAPQAVATRTEAWPVPAQGSLNLAPAPTAQAQAVELLDALGRPVLQQPLLGSATVTLPLDNIKPGIYLLRVTYSEGVVTRRIQVQ
ncbi:T9SS type A sorting domain-containing protein [Hymenobacter saemangeumensis]|uniref:T9SS type A sorting domain-containing protein n=1 Tax=Hymenobacter saemangeumensis TaxID=1084522 RepID=UPI0031EAFD0F